MFTALFALALPAALHAQVWVLDFEGLRDFESISNYYNGGLGGYGSGPGMNWGITFAPSALALIDGDDGGTGNFENNPSGKTVAFFQSGGALTMNVASGFDSGFSFFYSAVSFPGEVRVWSGLDATGTLLATIFLAATGSSCGVPAGRYGDYNCWDKIGVSFAGLAHSVDFGGTANQIAFDNITLGSATPGGETVTPEPVSMALLGTGLAGVAAARRRRRERDASQPEARG